MYPDLQTKPTINKMIKNFIPDTGLPTLRTLIEYKYVDSVTVAKNVCDQILAEVCGYASDLYINFVFVIYEHKRFRRAEDWQSALDKSGSRTSLTAILLKGIEPKDADKNVRSKYLNQIKRTTEIGNRPTKPPRI